MSLMILLAIGLFIGFLATRLYIGGAFVKNSYAPGSFWVSCWGKRQLSDGTISRLSAARDKSSNQSTKRKLDNGDEEEINTHRGLLAIDE